MSTPSLGSEPIGPPEKENENPPSSEICEELLQRLECPREIRGVGLLLFCELFYDLLGERLHRVYNLNF